MEDPKRYRVVGTQRLYIDKRWYNPGDIYEGEPHPALLNVRPQDRHLELVEEKPEKSQGTAKKAAAKGKGKPEGED